MKNTFLRNDEMSVLFLVAIEATEESIHNSLFAAETMTGREDHTVETLTLDLVMKIVNEYRK